MKRRVFIRRLMLYTAGLALAPARIRVAASAALSGARPDVASVTGADYASVVRQAIDLLGGMKRFVHPAATVVIKPNIGWDRPPEMAANTNPLVVRTLIELALDAGAGNVLLFDRTCNEPRRCYVNSGMEEMTASLRNRAVRLEHIDRRKFVTVDIPRGESLATWDIYKEVLDADCYINVPVAKHHGLSRLTLGLKNSMGAVGGNRGSLHHDLGRKLADLATVVAPDLTVVDATRILLRNGPQGGRLEDVRQADTVIASADPVAADALATTLFGLRPEDISSTVAAHRRGLGQMDLNRIRLLERTL